MLEIILFVIVTLVLLGFCVWVYKTSPKDPKKKFERFFRALAFRMIIALVVQFFVGIAVNLWITLPTEHPGSDASNYFVGVNQGITWVYKSSGIALLILHVTIALLLIVFVLVMLIQSLAKRNRFWIMTNILGALFIEAAFFNGASFLNYSQQVSSLLMEIFFFLAISTYIIALYNTKPLGSASKKSAAKPA